MTLKVKYRLNGKVVTEKEFSRHKPAGRPGIPAITKTYTSKRPMRTEFDGVMEHQVDEMRDVIRQENIPGVKVLPNGTFEITSRRGRARLNKLRALHDKDAGYGD